MPHKNPLFSKRIQGSVVMLLGMITMMLGVDFDEEKATEAMQAAALVVGWAWNLYGSIVAKHRLTKDDE